jgi:pimeloyl-ACP methyl ester carboxylesterase
MNGLDPSEIARLSTMVEVDGLSFPVFDHGTGPVVLLLHGFPDSRFLWRHQIGPLVDAGFRVVAPDLRGFGDAPRPEGVELYRFPLIMRDVVGLLDALQIRQARVVGHDWGSALAWSLAAYQPDRVEQLVALSVGAPGNPGGSSMAQREKFWYVLYFQFEGIAEAGLADNDWQLFKAFMRGEGDAERYLRDLARPGALTAALNWYRANLRPQMPAGHPPPAITVSCPTLGIWGDRDFALTEDHMRKSSECVTGPWRYEKLEGAGHWMMLEQPAALNRLLLEFLDGAN